MHENIDLKERIFNVLPLDGSLVSNARIVDELGISRADFWGARNLLIKEGRAIRGRGRGGSTARVLIEEFNDVQPEDAGIETPVIRHPEEALYAPLKKVLAKDWQADKGFEYLDVLDVSRGGGRNTGGTWTRPDLVAVEVQIFTYCPTKTLSVHTFEVKPSDMIDVKAVYEALAHRRAATHSYVLLHIADDGQPPASLEDVIAEARRHGIGVIIFSDPLNYDTWDEKVVAERVEPEPFALDRFIRVQVPEDVRNKIEKAVR
ncbi:hypothetical protein ACUH90_03410 [Dermabacteraceae bacterium P7054]